MGRIPSSLRRPGVRLGFAPILQASRPGLWPTQLWFYLLPLGGRHLLGEWTFWLGAVYVGLPLALLLYGWNDLGDAASDRANPRKGTYLFGACLSDPELRRLPAWIAAVQLPFLGVLTWTIGPKFLLWIAATGLVNALYNQPPFRLKSRPFLDLANQTGYLLVFVLSSWLNEVPHLPPPVLVFGALFAMHSHLAGQIMDVEPDRQAGRRTTAVVIGVVRAKLLLAGLLALEAALLTATVSVPLVGVFLAGAALVFLTDAILRRDRLPTVPQMRALLVLWNIAALGSMVWIWRTALFVK